MYLNGKISNATKYRETTIIKMSLKSEYDKLIPKIEEIASRTK